MEQRNLGQETLQQLLQGNAHVEGQCQLGLQVQPRRFGWHKHLPEQQVGITQKQAIDLPTDEQPLLRSQEHEQAIWKTKSLLHRLDDSWKDDTVVGKNNKLLTVTSMVIKFRNIIQ